MQVKKFEAPTIQEALDTIKRELGPEAIILQTKKNKRGFGLMSKESVEVTAAVSDRSLQKKAYVEKRLPEPSRQAVKGLPADRQADMYEKYLEKATSTRDQVQIGSKSRAAARTMSSGAGAMAAGPAKPAETKKITATRYIDIDDEESTTPQPAARPAQRPVSASGATAAGPVMAVEEEMKHLKRMIEELKMTQETARDAVGAQAMMGQSGIQTPALQDAFDQLVMNGVDKRYAFGLIKKVAFELGTGQSSDPDRVADQMAEEIMKSTEVASALSGVSPRAEGAAPVVVALVGPTGVGKTTTVAKMASEALLRRNLKVGLINLDSYKVAAFDQLGTYAKILNVPFRSVATVEDLKAALADFRSLDLVLVDTTGRSQKDPESLREMQALVSAIPDVRTELVLSVTTRDAELYDMASRFSIFRPQGLILSKLDEAMIYGAIYNVSQKVKLPVLYFTTGQRVPEDIEEATRERVAALILDL